MVLVVDRDDPASAELAEEDSVREIREAHPPFTEQMAHARRFMGSLRSLLARRPAPPEELSRN